MKVVQLSELTARVKASGRDLAPVPKAEPIPRPTVPLLRAKALQMQMLLSHSALTMWTRNKGFVLSLY